MAGGLAEQTPVDVHQFETELQQILEVHRELSAKTTLEIGTYDGGTLYWWLQQTKPGGKVVSVDLYETTEHDNRELYAEWTPKGVKLLALEASSTDPKTKERLRRLQPFDFAFIDGDHSYASVLSDYELCLEVVRPGGVIALHDIVPPPDPVPWMEVDQLWEEIQADRPTREFIATSYQTWGGIGVVYV